MTSFILLLVITQVCKSRTSYIHLHGNMTAEKQGRGENISPNFGNPHNLYYCTDWISGTYCKREL